VDRLLSEDHKCRVRAVPEAGISPESQGFAEEGLVWAL
jgi:hypothetical protein